MGSTEIRMGRRVNNINDTRHSLSLNSGIYQPVPLQYHEISPTRKIAFRKFEGSIEPTILYIPGFFSTMNLNKVVILEQYATDRGYSNLRYDQECSGLSTGDQRTIEFEHWLEDALVMLDNYTMGKVVVVASSLGCWIATIMMQRRPGKIAGMLFLSPGFNCLWTGYWYHYNLLPPEMKEKVDKGEEQIKIKMKYGGWGILRRDFCERTLDFEIDFEKPVEVNCPIRIIHGIRDHDVPHEFCLMAMEKFTSKDIDVIYRKMGDHRLMTPNDVNLISYEVDRLVKHCQALDKGCSGAPPLVAKL